MWYNTLTKDERKGLPRVRDGTSTTYSLSSTQDKKSLSLHQPSVLFGKEPQTWEVRSKDSSRPYPLTNGEQKIGKLGYF